MGSASSKLTDLSVSNISFDIIAPAVESYYLDIPRGSYTVEELLAFTDSGTCTVSLRIRPDGGSATDITGLAAVAVSSTRTNPQATANNVITADDELILVVTANTAGAHLRGHVGISRS